MIKGFTYKHPQVGKRVEIPVWSDQWMRGARYGVIHSVAEVNGKTVYAVRMDHPQIRRLYKHFAENFKFI